MIVRLLHPSILLALLLLAAPAFAQQNPPIPPTPADLPGSIGRMDYGPVIAHTIHAKWPKGNTSFKGLGIRLTDPVTKKDAVMVYDTDLMRIAAAATGGYLDISKTNYTSYKGVDDAHLAGRQIMGTSRLPGWANPKDGSLSDPRRYPNGPLPRSWTHFKGYYRHGEQVILSYTVGESDVLELPGMEVFEGRAVFTRTFEIRNVTTPLQMVVCDLERDNKTPLPGLDADGLYIQAHKGASVAIVDNLGSATLSFHKNQVIMTIAPAKVQRLKIFMAPSDVIALATRRHGRPVELGKLTQGGPAQWKETVETKGTRSTAKGAYVIDTLTVPEKNPWNSWMRLVGFDFFKDGTRAAVSTWNGDVWIVSGIDDSLNKLTWKRFATGLYEPLGLVIKDDQIYALGYDRITRLVDLNDDGEADFYENFHGDWITHPRAYTLCLSTDSKGNFYTIANGNRAHGVPEHGAIHRVSADGSRFDRFASGMRSANGLGVGPGDVLAVADQEGNWTPASRIDIVREGDYIGYQPHAPAGIDKMQYKRPLCWLPKDVDKSAGDLLWVPDDPQSRWGPLKGQLLGMSYGLCKLYLVPYETVAIKPLATDAKSTDGETKMIEQGGVVAFPLNFASGIMRARFNPRDGQLYLAGLKGWQTRAALDAGLFRVRYTGGKPHMPIAIHPIKAGVKLTFTDPLDREIATDVSSYQVQRWNYVYSDKYGSPEFSVADPAKQGRDTMRVTGASLSEDGRTVMLEIADMKPVMQMMIKMNLESEEGDAVRHEAYHTVHVLGER